MTDPDPLDDAALQRYARHLLLPALGVDGQRRLLAAHALVVGAGGLGSPALLYLAASGVGRLTVVDPDCVELTNLQRQIAHATSRLGLPKADSARASAAALNPGVRIDARVQRADAALLEELVPQADVVLDCSDNWRTRHAVNAACVRHGRPLVAGAALGVDAQVSVFDRRAGAAPSAPCYACVFPREAAAPDADCATLGVFAPLVGIVGSLQAAEALKLLAGCGTSLAGRLLMLDVLHLRFDEIAVARDRGCSVCGDTARAAASAHEPPEPGASRPAA